LDIPFEIHRSGAHRLQTPSKQPHFWGEKKGFAEELLTLDFLAVRLLIYRNATFIQLDEALDIGLKLSADWDKALASAA
jgi:hypothetical protein